MEISIFDIIGNGVSNEEISETIVEKLHEKYQEEFLVKMIGNRYGTSTNDTVTTYCSPKNNENLIFTAILNKEQTILEDDYQLRSVAFELEENIKKEFKENNIDVIVKSEIIGKNKLDEFLSVQEFIDKFNSTNFLAYIISNNVISNEILKKVYECLEARYKNIYLKTLIYMIDEHEFKECYEIASTMPIITDSIIAKYSVKDEAIIKIFKGKIDRIK